MSPTTNTSGWPGSVQSGSTSTCPALSVLAPVASARAAASGEAWTPAAQTFARHAIRSSPSGPWTTMPSASTSVTRVRIRSSTPARSISLVAIAHSRSPKRRQRLLAPVEQQHASARGIDAAEVVLQGASRQLCDLPRHLDAGRARPDHGEREPGPLSLGVLLQLCHLERPEDAGAQLERIVDRLHPGRELAELVVAEVRAGRACRDDQRVVRHRQRRAERTGRRDGARVEVEALHVRELHASRSGACAAPRAAAAQPPPRRGSPSRAGRAAAGTCGGSCDRSASHRQARAAGTCAANRPPKPPPTITTRCRAAAISPAAPGPPGRPRRRRRHPPAPAPAHGP